ncbi:MAG: hypothetical protein HC799_07600 [Limnothrix sp. RL_2_0]|nr:hypothetical protein [Limnothrix sp. RL_2_0]
MDCIKLDYEQISETQIVCHGVSFVLNQESLLELLEAKENQHHPKFTDGFLLDWRHYVLFQANNDLQNGWSFTLTYEGQGIFRTLISLDGDVLNQVCSDILPHSTLYGQLSEIHYWLMQQLLERLRWPRYRGRWVNPVAWGVAIAMTGCIFLLYFRTLMAQRLFLLLLPVSLWLLQRGLRYSLKLVAPYLQGILLQQILSGKLSSSPASRKQGLTYLTKF